MSKKIFSEQDQLNLSTNKYVIRISDKAITYADEFKQVFIDQYLAGKPPREIFEANGFDVNIIGKQRVKQCAERWRKAYEKDGVIGLADSRKESSGRPLKRELTQDEVIARQEAKIKLLESQVQWGLKKMTPVQYRNHLLLAS